jgi:hypothetical protein
LVETEKFRQLFTARLLTELRWRQNNSKGVSK